MADAVPLAVLQQRLMAHLQRPDATALSLVAEQPPLTAEARLSIYANAYRVRLAQCLENDHEMLAAYLGDEQFASLCDDYIQASPSRVRSLRHFGDGLPVFLRRHAPYDGLPVLAELARFERELMNVFDAADAPFASRDDLRSVPAAHWPELRLVFHPSVRMFETRTNAVAIWQALKHADTPPGATHDTGTTWLLWRGEDRLSQFRSLPHDEVALLQAAMSGTRFAALCEMLVSDQADTTISQIALQQLLDWIDQGLIQGLQWP